MQNVNAHIEVSPDTFFHTMRVAYNTIFLDNREFDELLRLSLECYSGIVIPRYRFNTIRNKVS